MVTQAYVLWHSLGPPGVPLCHHEVTNFLNNYIEASDIVVKASASNSPFLNHGVIFWGCPV